VLGLVERSAVDVDQPCGGENLNRLDGRSRRTLGWLRNMNSTR
jgi:hypothetical protein